MNVRTYPGCPRTMPRKLAQLCRVLPRDVEHLLVRLSTRRRKSNKTWSRAEQSTQRVDAGQERLWARRTVAAATTAPIVVG